MLVIEICDLIVLMKNSYWLQLLDNTVTSQLLKELCFNKMTMYINITYWAFPFSFGNGQQNPLLLISLWGRAWVAYWLLAHYQC